MKPKTKPAMKSATKSPRTLSPDPGTAPALSPEARPATRRPPKAHEPAEDFWRHAFRLTALGWTLALAILAGMLAGRWLDLRLGLGGRATIAGLLLGVAAAFAALVRALRGQP
jgi:hypothetical protein